ncbi:MAG TPA: 2-dehydropantoate 2-reductase [Solirubrobacteraceae bacterium]|jgi:2-dehydropantoate 2-reductase|nr:2-dehydropantoate 2-reductase [Solirubrobacteraceae bacterium]
MESIAVLGAGGVGGFMAGALARAGEPMTLVAREPTAAVIARDGLHVRSVLLGDFNVRPQVVSGVDDRVDALLVATKASALQAALERVRAQPDLVVPLLNGLDHMGPLRERFGDRAVAGAIRIESDRPAPGVIVQTSPFLRVELASDGPGAGPAMEALAAALERAAIPAAIGESEAQVLWGKLVRLNALACTTAAADRPLGFIRSDPEWSAALAACVSEGAVVARVEGARIETATVLGELEAAHDTLGSSMQRDIAAGREPELDQIAGPVLRAGARHGLACPTIARLAEIIARRAGVAPPAVAAVAD